MQKLGYVTQGECDNIRTLYSRRSALEELLTSLKDISKNEELYEKIVADIITSKSKMQEWWLTVSAKYNWMFSSDDNWGIDFNTMEVYLNEA